MKESTEDRLYFEDIPLNEEIETLARTITEADIVNFAGISGDFHPLHMNKEFAAKTPFGERIAHGLLSLCVTSGLAFQTPQKPLAFVAFLGLNWQFKLPVKIGDTIRAKRKVVGKRETKDGKRGIVTIKNIVVNQKDEVVQEGETIIMVLRKGK